MIAKNIKGKSFKGCVQYAMNETAELLEAEGVFADNTKDIIRSFVMQRSGRKEIKQPVGRIPISFSPEDRHRMTNDFMLQLAIEYMLETGIKNTQYIIVRHHNTDNNHLHIVYNRIDNNLKLISVNHDYKRNIKLFLAEKIQIILSSIGSMRCVSEIKSLLKKDILPKLKLSGTVVILPIHICGRRRKRMQSIGRIGAIGGGRKKKRRRSKNRLLFRRGRKEERCKFLYPRLLCAFKNLF